MELEPIVLHFSEVHHVVDKCLHHLLRKYLLLQKILDLQLRGSDLVIACFREGQHGLHLDMEPLFLLPEVSQFLVYLTDVSFMALK